MSGRKEKLHRLKCHVKKQENTACDGEVYMKAERGNWGPKLQICLAQPRCSAP